jgi:pyruvate formate lyase activating enzyme
VHELRDGRHALRREACTVCGECARRCPTRALQIKGQWVSSAEVVRRAERLRPFFDHSGGGITLTGGEVTGQPAFAEAVLAGCRAAGIHTAVETCGACEWETLERLLEHVDLVLYDLKVMDEAAHRKWTGATNRRILANARRLAGRNVRLRVPRVGGITDTPANLRGIFEFMHAAGLSEVELLPFNDSAAAKYEWLGRAYGLNGARLGAAPPADAMRLAERLGLKVLAGDTPC